MTFQKSIFFLCISSLLLSTISCTEPASGSDSTSNTDHKAETMDQDDCSWCGTSEVPSDVSWKTVIPSKEEPGEKLIISGTVFMSDGATPAADVVVYVYHTNIEGVYPKTGSETGNGKYHGYLRAWMKTDLNGQYQFETIRPAPYHSHGGEPAHIHYNIEGPDHPEYWLTGLWFSDDPRVTEQNKKDVERSGGFPNITTLTKDDNNVLRGSRNIILEKFE